MIGIKREPGVAYIDTHKWVPKDHPDIPVLRGRYRYYLPGSVFTKDSDGELLYMWRETPNHLVVPRTAQVQCDFVDLRPNFKKISLKSNIVLDHTGGRTQKDAFDAWMTSNCGVLNLACGKGKTVIALRAIAEKNTTALIILGTNDLMNQWRDSIRNFLSNFSLGIIRGTPSEWDWERDIVLASAKSLSKYIKYMGPKFFTYFGLILYDECHHAPAISISATTDVFWGERRGLTATVYRGDGRDPILLNNIGPVFYKDLMPNVSVRVCFQITPFKMDFHDVKEVLDITGQRNTGKVRTYIGTHQPRNEWIIELLLWILERKRKVLAISHSKDQMYLLYEMMNELFDSNAICTGDEDSSTRLDLLKEKRMGFGTSQLVREALDMPDLDVLVVLSPFSESTPGANALQQAMGRAQRGGRDKLPWIIILMDLNIPVFSRQSTEMVRMMNSWPAEKGGPINYFITPADQRPDFSREA
jgi:superfamily II DNA or RNA helicase